MSGASARGKAYLFVVATMLLFAGLLALPFLMEQDVVRLRFGESDGLRVQGGGLEDALPSIGLDGGDDHDSAIRAPRAIVTSPHASGEVAFVVGWDSDGPDPALLYAFHLQYGVVNASEDGEIAWDDWFHLRRSDVPRNATFTGEPGVTYAFRGRACHLGLACSVWSEPVLTEVAAAAERPVISLSLVPQAPKQTEVVDGIIALQWTYDHRGPGTAMVDVTLERPDAAPVPLYTGQGLSATWDTTRHEDGDHTLRLRLSDGAHHIEHRIPISIQNGIMPTHGEDDAAEDEVAEDTQESPAPFPVAALAIAILAARARRRA